MDDFDDTYRIPHLEHTPHTPSHLEVPSSAVDSESTAALPSAIDALDFIEMKFRRRKTLLTPWLPERGLALLHGPRGAGKSFLAMSAAYTVASGGSFLGWTATAPQGVIYVDGEMPSDALQERLQGIILGADAEIKKGSLKLLCADQNYEGLPNLTTPKGQQWLEQEAKGCQLIVLDNIATLIGLPENDQEHWKPIQDWLLHLRRMGFSVLLIHHQGKRAGNQRGSSAREDVVDTVISLTLPGEHIIEDGCAVHIEFQKSRNFWGADAAPLDAKLLPPEDGAIRWERFEADKEQKSKAVELKKEGKTQREIAEQLGVHQSTVSRWLRP